MHGGDEFILRGKYPEAGWPIGGLDECPANDSRTVDQEEARELISCALHVVVVCLS
jgi:hypothetical protein